MDPVSILSAISLAVSTTAKVTNTLLVIDDEISTVDRNLQQFRRDVTDLQDVLERMRQDFSSPEIRASAFESQTGIVGNHWTAVLKLIERCDRILAEMEVNLRNVPKSGGGAWTKPLRAGWLKFKEGDIAYYRSEVQLLTRNMQFELTMVLVYVVKHAVVAAFGGLD